jgi:hypothetical protein
MNFLENNLETIIYKELEFCRTRGFMIEPYEQVVYRQLNLAPYGLPDLIHIGRNLDEDVLRVRIIECKRNVIDIATYAQASRYQSALSRILDCCCSSYEFEIVLVGQKIDARNDFWGLTSRDLNCEVYTYEYLANGIRFKRHKTQSSFGTAYAAEIHRPSVNALIKDVNAIMPDLEEEEDES